MQFVSKLLLSIILLTTFAGAKAQVAQTKTLANVLPMVATRDTTRFFQGVTLNIDLIGPLQAVTGDYGHYEAGLRVNLLDRYFPAIEVGYGSSKHDDDFDLNLHYESSAPYFRLGMDYNILKYKHDVYRMYAGGRYSFSSYKYDITTSEIIGEGDDKEMSYTTHNGLSGNCHWIEGVFGVDAQIWKNFHLGWDLRYKRRLFQKKADAGEPWYVPGMGKNNGSQIWGRFLVMLEF